ncbi:polysaccharide pyruvyl transferase family protein [Corynebacterium variabile]|uniref:polysaccharide pyruvyl transferase family protein n=1 Tax=Corynebacterium variabile TaxID=1727 RepID=UPI003F9263CE
MTRSVIVLHCYSSRNRGDGLLVEETLALIREALGEDTRITLLASDPESFSYLGIPVLPTKPSIRGWDRRYLRELTRLGSHDLVVGVGGGYFRAGHLTEAVKCALVMGPQLLAAAVTSTPTLYLPQSIGPLRGGTLRIYRSLLRRLSTVILRDDRSVAELRLPGALRTADLAISSPLFTDEFSERRGTPRPDSTETVISVRKVHGLLPAGIPVLAGSLRTAGVPLVGYVQSTVGGNNDTEAQRMVTTERSLSEEEFLRLDDHRDDLPRVVVAVRMHAALLALRAGHRVIHLSYERKGFSAFADLGLADWVHNANSFNPDLVTAQVIALRDDTTEQQRYDDAVRKRIPALQQSHNEVMTALRQAAGIPSVSSSQD